MRTAKLGRRKKFIFEATPRLLFSRALGKSMIVYRALRRKTAPYSPLKFVCLLLFLSVFFPTCLFWLCSGIVSSIGFGTGANTGILHLMPYQAALAQEHSPPTALGYALVPTTFHAIGSALGELPPFLFQESVLRRLPAPVLLSINRLIPYVREYGSIIVFIFGVWPSVMFDVCGVTASLVGMPIHRFLLSTIAGKLIKSYGLCYMVVYNSYRLPDMHNVQGYTAPVLLGVTMYVVYCGIIDLIKNERLEETKTRDTQ
jgi:hypothetical protein